MTDSICSAIALAFTVAAWVIGFGWFTPTGWAIAAALALAAVFLTPFG
jgi:hypothetical protein